MWKYHCCYGYIINCAFCRIKLFQWNGLVFHWCSYNKINRTLHGRLEIRNFSSRVENISLVRCAHSWNIFQHLKRNFVFSRGHVISSIYYYLVKSSLAVWQAKKPAGLWLKCRRNKLKDQGHACVNFVDVASGNCYWLLVQKYSSGRTREIKICYVWGSLVHSRF